MISHLKYVHIDAFTRTPFRGNPAAVCMTPNELREEQMQTIAMELALSETAFLTRRADGDFSLRWFTPINEVDLCGHATLASAHFLWSEGILGHRETARFHTKSGLLVCEKRADHICMDFPELPVAIDPAALERVRAWDGVVQAASREDYLLVELESEALVREFQPDFAEIARLPQVVVMITAPSGHSMRRDFVSRVFVPRGGIPEDPVTGSAHCALGPYWMAKLGLDRVQGEQLSRRTGVVNVERLGDRRLLISGQAVTTAKGIFTVIP